jgi:YidC/Oxa1 family membrane protein insertase
VDKKNITFGSIFVIAAAICFYVSNKYYPPRPNPAAVHAATGAQPAGSGSTAESPTSAGLMPESASTSEFAATSSDRPGATITRLQNSYIEVSFTDNGGSIRDVALEKFPATQNSPSPFVLNELHKDPVAAFVQFPGLDRSTKYTLVSHTDREIVFRTIWNKQLEVTRRYVLSPDEVGKTDPYQLRTETTFRNLTGQIVTLPGLQMALGTAAPVSTKDFGLQLNSGFSTTNSKQTFLARAQLEPSNGILGMVGGHGPIAQLQNPGPIAWAVVSNQFFASLLTPDQPAAGLVTRRVKLLNNLPDSDNSAYGITADAVLTVPPIAANSSVTLGAQLYVGPKEYSRLANTDVFGADQDKVMNFGIWHWFSELLLNLLHWMHHISSNWGVAIILATLALKIVFVPFTLAASRSAKRMQKLQPELAAIKTKFKDNPQKQQMATMELFKANKVNPVGGCLPMLITLPFFFGFYRMLSSSAELRFAPFLWAHDLSAPDTVGHLFGFPINILPVLLGATMLLQMQLTPQPSVDNSQAKMMKLMPLIFMFFCYSYSCALSLYSTVNALFTIVQQLVINRMHEADPVVAPAGKGLKNVTPKRK